MKTAAFSRGQIAVGVALALACIAWWTFKNPVDSIRYRLTLEVDVDGRRVTGSGVVRVDYIYDYFRFLNIDMPSNIPRLLPYAYGEAVVVDLGARGVLFATLAPDHGRDFRTETTIGDTRAERIVPFAWGRPPILQMKDLSRLHQLPQRVNLSFDKMPMLVRFRNLDDLKTMERVEPGNLAKNFGPGVRLVSAVIDITNDQATYSIRSIVPSLTNILDEKYRRTRQFEGPPVRGLFWSDFARGVLRSRRRPAGHRSRRRRHREERPRAQPCMVRPRWRLFRQKTDRLEHGDGFLALDRNGNGRIDDISEIFGGRFDGAFADLAQEDSSRERS